MLGIKINKRFQAFTLVEMLISMAIVSIVLVATIPAMTQFSTQTTGKNQNVNKCITNNSSSWYNDTTGATSAATSGSECYLAIEDTQHNRNKAVETTTSIADNGTSSQKIMAKKIFRAACDLGGQKSCDYFLTACLKNTDSGTAPYCDDTSSFLDLTYYLHLNKDTYLNNGATYIGNQINSLIPKMPVNLINELSYARSNNQTPDAGADYQNLNDNIAYELTPPKFYILACNGGYTSACTTAHDNNFNKSCYQIKTNWTDAPTGDYMLTYDGASSPVSTSCNLTSTVSAAVSGCNAAATLDEANNCSTASPASGTNCSNDCYIAYTNGYNRTCLQVSAFWAGAPSGTYRLTTNGAPPTVTVSGTCPVAGPHAACIAAGQGSNCGDGTYYISNYNGRYLFTIATDGSNNKKWSTVSVDTGSTNMINGNTNYPILAALGVNYQAEYVCKQMNDANTHGYNDWYLPSQSELYFMYTKKAYIPGITDNGYWGSSELGATTVYTVRFSDGDNNWTGKTASAYVRCIRDE